MQKSYILKICIISFMYYFLVSYSKKRFDLFRFHCIGFNADILVLLKKCSGNVKRDLKLVIFAHRKLYFPNFFAAILSIFGPKPRSSVSMTTQHDIHKTTALLMTVHQTNNMVKILRKSERWHFPTPIEVLWCLQIMTLKLLPPFLLPEMTFSCDRRQLYNL